MSFIIASIIAVFGDTPPACNKASGISLVLHGYRGRIYSTAKCSIWFISFEVYF